MEIEDFAMATVLAEDGWEYRGQSDSGDYIFTRVLGGVLWGAEIRRDR